MSQNAMSLLPSERRKRRPIVWASSRKIPTAAAMAIGTGAPMAAVMNANAIQPMPTPISPSLGLYVKRTSA